jgi:YesN/AraC family two-component response regulator
MGIRTITAEDGARALFLFTEHQRELDAILLDVNMPVMDGRDALVEIFAQRPDMPVVILSGYGHDEKIREMLALGCRDFIQKPVDAQVLLSTLENIFVGAPH